MKRNRNRYPKYIRGINNDIGKAANYLNLHFWIGTSSRLFRKQFID